ncbi:MAG TPA: 3-oxoacyl-[acyl-carrier-protein] reductase [Planctomycetota bacterium]|nr:3-oxoacyl-[acyl-carrier-protein] reductase [Planctomycetota bacterium]
MLLEDRCAIVTGASRGIGKAIAVGLARAGANVALFATDEGKLKAVADEIAPLGRKVFLRSVDLRKTEAVKEAIEAAKESLGGLDILVNNAGITRDQLLLRMKDEEWSDVLDVNLGGAFRCSKAAARYLMKSKAGRIINVTSIVGLKGQAGQANYAASKAGIVGFTKSLAKELASRGVTVNAIAPGYITTDMTAALPAETKGAIEKEIPLARVGTPEDVAGVAVFLASDAAAYVTGETIRVDGGLAM